MERDSRRTAGEAVAARGTAGGGYAAAVAGGKAYGEGHPKAAGGRIGRQWRS